MSKRIRCYIRLEAYYIRYDYRRLRYCNVKTEINLSYTCACRPTSKFCSELENYVSLLPTFYAAVHLELRNLTLTFDLLNWKLSHRLILPRETFTLNFGFSTLFWFRFSNPYGTDGA